MTMRARLLALLCLFVASASNAAPAFHYDRPVIAGGPGPNRLNVDGPLLGGARRLTYSGTTPTGGLEDLRLYDAAGQEVAYLLIPPALPAEEWEPGSLLPIAATEKRSGFEVDLHQLRHIDRLRLSGVAAPFLKRVSLEGSGDRQRWVTLVAEGTLFDLPEERLVQTELSFPPADLRYLRLRWDDRNSAVVSAPASASVHVAGPGAAPPALRLAVTFERRPSEPRVSRFRIHLPAAHLPIAALQLTCGGEHLRRKAEVTEPRLFDTEVKPTMLGTQLLQRTSRGDAVADDLRIALLPPQGPQLDLEVDDGDNPPLDLTGVEIELLPLPWIFFESRGGENLTARFGDPKLAAPRYDLEAVRRTVDKLTLHEAHWGERRTFEPAEQEAAQMTDDLPAGGPLQDRPDWQFTRSIDTDTAGLAAIVLDAAVLAHSPQLRDLRIVDANGQQVPYVLERLAAPLSVELPDLEPLPARTPQYRSESRYRLQLPSAQLPPSQLVLQTSSRVFQRHVAVLVERPAKDARSEPFQQNVAMASWQHRDPSSAASDLVLVLPPLPAADAELRMDEGDNAPLPLGRPRLLLPGYRLRFFVRAAAETPLTLLYGNPRAAAPRYDLSLLAPRVLEAAVQQVALGPEVGADADRRARRPEGDIPRQLFWGALGIAVVGLLVLIARLLRTPAKAPPP